jgi:hypothetical protein
MHADKHIRTGDDIKVSMLSSSAVDRGFISGVMVSMLSSSAVDRGFISGVMVSMLSLSGQISE